LLTGLKMPNSSFVVYSTGGKFDALPPSAQAILGEYWEEGENHGRKVYKRMPTAAQKNMPPVMLFFWDERNGPDLSGWWFGDKIGAGQVWSRCEQASALPPMKGWRCPVDGPANRHIVCIPKIRGKDDPIVEAQAEVKPLGPTLGSKRVLEGGGRPAAKKLAQGQTLSVESKLGEEATDEVKRLVGDYVEISTNHGKKVYEKKDSTDPVCLYYWDQRDGWDFAGWWFGESVGSEEVYGRSQAHSSTPPLRGWRVPFDGPAKSDVSLVLRGFEEEAEMPLSDRVQKVKTLVQDLEGKVDKAVSTADSMLSNSEGDLLEEGIEAVVELLEAQSDALANGKASLERHAKAARKQAATEDGDAELTLYEERLDGLFGSVDKELSKAKQELRKAQLASAEERDEKAFETELPETMRAVSEAELAIENATSQAEASRAKTLLTMATRRVKENVEKARAYAPEVQKIALKEFFSLRERCGSTAQRLAVWGLTDEDVLMDAGVDVSTSVEDAGIQDPADDIDMDEEAAIDDEMSEEELIKHSTDKVAGVEAKAKEALDTSEEVLKQDVDERGTQLLLDLLEDKLAAVTKMEKVVAKQVDILRTKMLSSTTEDALRALGPRLQFVRARVKEARARAMKKLESFAQQKREEQKAKAVDNLLPEVEKTLQQAADALEAVIASAEQSKKTQAPIDVEIVDESIEEQKAIEKRQVNADKAQDGLVKARRLMDTQVRASKSLPQEQQQVLLEDMAPLKKRLLGLQKKLNPYKKVRHEYNQKIAIKQELSDLGDSMEAVEADIEKVSAVFAGTAPSEESVKRAESSLLPIEERLSKQLAALLAKEKGSFCATNYVAIQERGRQAKRQVEALQEKARERKKALAAEVLLQAAEKETLKAEVWLAKIAEAEKPWADGVEVPRESAAKPALTACTTLANQAEPAVKASKVLVMEKLVDLRQVPEGPVRFETAEALMKLQARVEAVALKVTQLKVDTSIRTTNLLIPEVIIAVSEAEDKTEKTLKVADLLEKDNLDTVKVADIKAVSKKIAEPAQVAKAACTAARKKLQKRETDPKFAESMSFRSQLLKMSNRLGEAEKTLERLQEASKTAEKSQAVFKAEKGKLENLKSMVDSVELQALPLGDEKPSEEADMLMANAVEDADKEVKAWSESVEALASKSAHGALKHAMTRMLKEKVKLQSRLADVRKMASERLERAFCKIFLEKGETGLTELSAAMAKVESADSEAVEQFEAAVAAVQPVLSKVKDFFTTKRKEAASFSDAVRASVSSLIELSRQVDAVAVKFQQFEKKLEGLKRAAAAKSRKAL